MNRFTTVRTLLQGVLLLVMTALLLGCGGTKPESSREKGQPRASSKGESELELPKPQQIELQAGAGKEAVAFLKSLGEVTAKSERLSKAFVKMVGLPAELPADRSRGYSPSAAESWLKQVGEGATFGLPSGFARSDAAVLGGGFQRPGRKGEYFLRLIDEEGNWKVDYFALTSAAVSSSSKAADGPELEYQRFAARAVSGVLCDKSAMPRSNLALVLAAGLSPQLRARLAEPFSSDRDQGFDYNRGKLLLEAEKIGGGAESYATMQEPTLTEFRLEVTRPGGMKASFLLKLTPGGIPGRWLVESITSQ